MSLRDIQKPRQIKRFYHGSSNLNIDKFDIGYSRKSFLDFGVGIYFTTNIEQAMIWSVHNSNNGAVYYIDIDTSLLNLRQYLTYSDKFIDTFCLCRAGFEDEAMDIVGCDSVYGYMIDNDKAGIIKSTNDYALGKATASQVRANIKVFDDKATASQVRANIKVFDDKDQLCIKKQDILDNITVKLYGYTKYNGKYARNDRRSVIWKK